MEKTKDQQYLEQFVLTRSEMAESLGISTNALKCRMRKGNTEGLDFRHDGNKFLFKRLRGNQHGQTPLNIRPKGRWHDGNKKKKKGLNINEIIKFLHIDHVVDKFPHQISSGEAQRASLARSLLSNPDLLLLDEPLSNVDQNFKEEIQVKLKQILTEHKITTIIVTHDSYEAFYLGTKCGIILDGQLKQYDDPYNVYHFPNSIEVVNFLNRGILIPAKVTGENSLESDDLGTITGDFIKHYPKGSEVQLLLQPEDLEHDDQSNLKLEVVDRKFRGTNFIYTLKTTSNKLIPVFVHSHHIHQHEVDEKFGIKRPINIDHIVCF